MGFYQARILPRLLDLAMRNHLLRPYRRNAIGSAWGSVLEIGVGSGVNLPLYGRAVDRVFAIDPSPELLRRATKRLAAASVPVSLIRASAEQLSFSDAAFDTVVMT
jgi:ubiquinone/menaquinone biosynthesis C-methylase UbiE